MGCDLACLSGDVSFPVEVKSSKDDVIHFSDARGRNNEQALAMLQECERARVVPVYAYRLKGKRGDAWRLFTLPTANMLNGVHAVMKSLPLVEVTKNGVFVLRWEHGMPLTRFLQDLVH